MTYQSIHTGPEIDAAATLLDDIQEIRDESNANKDTVVTLAAQVATDADRTEAAAIAVDGVVEAAESARDDAVVYRDEAGQHAADADTARAQAVVARNGAEAAESSADQHAADAQTAATTAGTHASNAASSEAVAAQAASDAAAAKDAAESARDSAQSSATSANTDAGRAEAAAASVDGVVAAAESARDSAQGYRNESEGFRDEAQQAAQDAESIAVGNVFDDSQARTDRGWTSHKLQGLFDAINAILASDDTDLDELQEIVDFIKLNRDELDNLSIASIAGLQTALDNKQPFSTVLTNTTASFTTALLSKLEGIAAGATKNATDAQLRDRSTHKGTQAASTITGLAAVATSGSYNDLTGKPTIPAAQVPADWNATSGVARILNKPTLGTAAAANTGDFATAAQGVKADTAYGWGNHATAGYALSSSLAPVATSGSYNDLSNKPSIPTMPGNATPSSSGLMSAADKAKLDAVGSMANRNATISTGDPSGGANGDVWFKVE